MAEEDTKFRWLWRALGEALPIHLTKKTILQVIATILAIPIVYFLQGEPQMTEELWLLLSASIAIVVVYVLSFIWALTGDPQISLDKKRRSALIAAVLAIGGSAFAFGRFGSRPEMKFAPPEELTGDIIRNHTFRITDMVDTQHLSIEGKNFRDRQIFGPAVLYLHGAYNTLDKCDFEGPVEALFWKIDPSQKAASGLVGIANCTFFGCRFRAIGFAGPAKQIDDMRQKIGKPQKN